MSEIEESLETIKGEPVEQADTAPAQTDEPLRDTPEQSTGLWPVDRLQPVVEAVLFAAADPLPVRRICDVVGGATKAEVVAALDKVRSDCETRGFRLVEVAGGWQFRTAPEHHDIVRRLFKERPYKLTRAMMETVAVVAYKQPATRAEVEAVRGVDSAGVLESLVERRLVNIAGRRDVPGRPLVYVTTREFLEVFGLKDLKALPTLAELGDDFRVMAERSEFNAQDERGAAILPLEETDLGQETIDVAATEPTGQTEATAVFAIDDRLEIAVGDDRVAPTGDETDQAAETDEEGDEPGRG
jgi:segregation and condensation protein B